MAKSTDSSKSQTSPKDANTSPQPAQHIWLAGLGAMAKAQEQGSKAIEALVNDGLSFQRKSQAEAQQRLQEATNRLTHMASDFGQEASGRVDRLEHLFEDRVAKALHRLGMPTLQDMLLLNERVAKLEVQLAQALQAQAGTGAKTTATKTRKTIPTKSAPATKASKPKAVAKTGRRTAA